MDKFEKLVNEIMKECADDGEPVTRAEAEEMAKMELGAKVNCKRYEQSTPTKKKAQKPRTVKISDEKKALFECILRNLDRCENVSRENVTVLKENKLISVQIGNKTFEINLVEKRPPKK
jgi:hypothetical protein